MADKPDIIVNIVHIEGPLKGEIQELSEPEIRIGRNFDCQVCFPADLLIVSRDHARIIREGNRYRLINKSANFTYLNGNPLEPESEAYLKSGDWLMFAQGGPKVSFLTKMAQAGQPNRQAPEAKPQRGGDAAPVDPGPSSGTPAGRQPEPESSPAVGVKVESPGTRDSVFQAIPLLIRYGPTLQRFKSLPVVIGKGAECDFTVDHPAVSARHAEIFYREGQYWVKDLTGRQKVYVDGRAVGEEVVLVPECKLALSPQGPAFMFLGGGRLDEIEA